MKIKNKYKFSSVPNDLLFLKKWDLKQLCQIIALYIELTQPVLMYINKLFILKIEVLFYR